MTLGSETVTSAFGGFKPRAILLSIFLITALLYIPGLSGGFLFDDYPNVVENKGIQITSSTTTAWMQAMWASPASDLQRPLASLSFALNHLFTGLDPWSMKLTNLCIHLLNGWLLFLVLRRILSGMSPNHPSTKDESQSWIPVLVTAAWLLHPINLGAVLFVVQRMESLAQVFVLLGLWLYLDARRRQSEERAGAGWRLWIGVPLCTILGVSAKESAALLPLYALILEWTVLRSAPRQRNGLIAFFCIFLFIPGLLGLAWLLPGVLGDGAYAIRPFTLVQRLLTEPRILLDYAAWTLLPLPGFFSFYRDDYPISTGLLSPPATLFAIAALLALVVAMVFLRKRHPLAALGIGWFLAGHALTGNILPLELVFEHRNYFASAGLLLAAISFVWPADERTSLHMVRTVSVVALLLLCIGSLGLRARVWGDPVLFAVSEAAQHPQSPRATYNLGRTYVILSGYRKDSANLPRAIGALEVASRAPRASILPEVGLIMVASRTNIPIDPAWWRSMLNKFQYRAPTAEDANAIKSLTLCQREGRCILDDEKMLQTYLAAVSRVRPSPSILYSYAIFAQNRLHDPTLALQLTRDAANSGDLQYRVNLVGFLIDLGRMDEARRELEKVVRRSRIGSYADQIATLEQRFRSPNISTDAQPSANLSEPSMPLP